MHNTKPFYQLDKRYIIRDSSIFKIKPLDEANLLFSIPDEKCILSMDNSLQNINSVYQFDNQPLALDIISIAEKKFILGGCHNGEIHIKPAVLEDKMKYEWVLSPENENQNFVNDIINFDNNVVVNCYNNGNIAIWGLASNRRLHTFPNLHDRYTYKLRKTSDNKIISCGADKMVYRVDLQKLTVASRYPHPNSVWCANQLDENSIGAVGLMRKLFIWDVRVNQTVQVCNLKGHESSFLLSRNKNQIVFGDMKWLQKCDRRKMQEEQLSNQSMLVSIEGIHISSNDEMIVCGRGSDLCKFTPSQSLVSLSLAEQVSRSRMLNIQKFNKNKEKVEEDLFSMENESESISSEENQPEVTTLKRQQFFSLTTQQQEYYQKIEENVSMKSIERYGAPTKEQIEAPESSEQSQIENDPDWVEEELLEILDDYLNHEADNNMDDEADEMSD